MTREGGWTVATLRATVAAAHSRALPEPVERSLTFVDPIDAAVVLGSTQAAAVLDPEALAARGLSVVRRRSGGGAVVVEPGALTWFDVVIPAGDRLWDDDVVDATRWVGRCCVEALRAVGVDVGEPATRMARTAWSSLVCFAGLGPGESSLAGKKVVGISQRRTRAATRFQVSILHRWDPVGTAGLFQLTPGERRELAGELARLATAIDTDPLHLRAALLAAFSAK